MFDFISMIPKKKIFDLNRNLYLTKLLLKGTVRFTTCMDTVSEAKQ